MHLSEYWWGLWKAQFLLLCKNRKINLLHLANLQLFLTLHAVFWKAFPLLNGLSVLFCLSLYPGMRILVLFGTWLPPLRIHSDFADGIYVCICCLRWSHTKIRVGHNYSWLWSILNWRHLCGVKYAELNNVLMYVAYCKCFYIL